MDLRKVIKEEIDYLSWLEDITHNEDDEIGRIWYKIGGIQKDSRGLILPLLVSQFSDVSLKGNKVYLHTDGYCDLIDLYTDRDNSQYGYVNQDLFRAIFCNEDFWEMYHNIVNNWQDEVWDLVEDDSEIFEHVLSHIKKHYINNEVTDMRADEAENTILNEEYLLWLKNNPSKLGELIDEDETFNELKSELEWAYESAYNTAGQDEVYKSCYGSIEDLLGKGSWTQREKTLWSGEIKKIETLDFEITELFVDMINNHFEACFDGCKGYYKGDPEADVDDFLEYCSSDCDVFDYSDFLGLLSHVLEESDDLLNPRFYEYPDSDDVAKWFKEDVYSRF
jgi:hypothetical protein